MASDQSLHLEAWLTSLSPPFSYAEPPVISPRPQRALIVLLDNIYLTKPNRKRIEISHISHTHHSQHILTHTLEHDYCNHIITFTLATIATTTT